MKHPCIVCGRYLGHAPNVICKNCGHPSRNTFHCSGCGKTMELKQAALVFLRQLAERANANLIIPERKGLVVQASRCTCRSSAPLKYTVFVFNAETN